MFTREYTFWVRRSIDASLNTMKKMTLATDAKLFDFFTPLRRRIMLHSMLSQVKTTLGQHNRLVYSTAFIYRSCAKHSWIVDWWDTGHTDWAGIPLPSLSSSQRARLCHQCLQSSCNGKPKTLSSSSVSAHRRCSTSTRWNLFARYTQ